MRRKRNALNKKQRLWRCVQIYESLVIITFIMHFKKSTTLMNFSRRDDPSITYRISQLSG